MKTTVEIDDALLVRAKKRAAELHKPLRALIQQGLRDQLAKRPQAERVREAPVEWVTVDGGIPVEAHIESREAMHEWINALP